MYRGFAQIHPRKSGRASPGETVCKTKLAGIEADSGWYIIDQQRGKNLGVINTRRFLRGHVEVFYGDEQEVKLRKLMM
jgi:hypothetical protein